jgi:hypothetical protein
MDSLIGLCDAQGRKKDEVEGEVPEFWSLTDLERSTFTNTLASLSSSLRFHILPIFY